jgi:AcrR family transcriptional regulator
VQVGQLPERLEPEDGGLPVPAWQWARTEQTRGQLLAAAREVFAEQGYTCAKVTDIAARAGLSVGSIYHHFGGKSELYLALWRRYNLAREDAAGRAVARARHAGVTDPAALWAAGARAMLRTTWKRRDLAALFCGGDGPPDFADVRQRSGGAGPGRAGDALVRLCGGAGGPLLAGVLAAVLSEGVRAIVAAPSLRQAEAVITDILDYGRRLMAAGPAGSAALPPDRGQALPRDGDRAENRDQADNQDQDQDQPVLSSS